MQLSREKVIFGEKTEVALLEKNSELHQTALAGAAGGAIGSKSSFG